MAYVAGDQISTQEYNGFLNNTDTTGTPPVIGINHIMGTGSLFYGLGQTALATTNTQEKITATQWNSLFTAMDNVANHANIAITSTGQISAGDRIDIKSALQTDLTALAAAVAAGSTGATALTTSAALQTVTTAAEGWDSTATQEVSVTFNSANAMRWFFNGGGKVRITLGTTEASVNPKDQAFKDLGIGLGNIDIGSQSTTRSGTLEVVTTNGLANGFYDLTADTYVSLIKLTSDNLTYTSNTVEIFVKINAAIGTATIMTVKMVATDAAADDQYTAGNTASVPAAVKDTPKMVTTLYTLTPNNTEGLTTVSYVSTTAVVSNTTT
jgi:hypothetical protein